MTYSKFLFRCLAIPAMAAMLVAANCSSPPQKEPAPQPKAEPQPEVKKRSAPEPDPADARKRAANLQSELLASLGGQLKEMPVFYYPPFRHELSESRFRSIFGNNLNVIKAIAGKVPAGYYLEVVGHANQHPRKSAEYTRELSTKRARQVYDHLVSAGIPAGKMKVKGVANSQPISASQPRNPKNRRVTFAIGVD